MTRAYHPLRAEVKDPPCPLTVIFRFPADRSMYIHGIMVRRKPSAPKSLVRDARAAVAMCAGCNSRLAARRITQFLDSHLADAGFGVAKFGLMAQIAAAGNDMLGALAQRTGLDQSTLSRNLRNLEAEGLVEIAAVERDLRRRAVWLTEKGARRLEAAIPVWRRAHAALSDLMDAKRAHSLASAAESLAAE